MEIDQTLTISLEIVPADENDADPAAVHAFASHALDALQREPGTYLVQPLPTNQRGGLLLLFQLVIQGIQAIDTALLAQKDTIDALVGLCTLFAATRAAILLLFKTHQRQSPPEQQHTLTVKMTIDDAAIEITSHDVADDQRVMELAERFHEQHPHVKPTSKSKITVQAGVPKRRSRARR
jgi:hypothetical protein